MKVNNLKQGPNRIKRSDFWDENEKNWDEKIWEPVKPDDDWKKTHSDFDHQHSSDDKSFGGTDIPRTFLFAILGWFVMFIIVLIIIQCIKCCQKYTNTSESPSRSDGINIPRPRRNRKRTTNCSHTYCNRYSNPFVGCILLGNNHRVWEHSTNDNYLTNDRNYLENDTEMDRLDIPLTYADSTENSRAGSMQNLHVTIANSNAEVSSSNNQRTLTPPPSYEQALAKTFTAATSVWENSAPSADHHASSNNDTTGGGNTGSGSHDGGGGGDSGGGGVD